MTTLHLICGLPGSGKSTFAKRLAQETGALVMSPDEWMSELGADIYDEEFRNKVERLQWMVAQDILKGGASVILENGFWSKQERDAYRSSAKSLGVGFAIHYLHADRDTLIARIRERNKTRAESERVSPDDLDSWIAVFEPPTIEELSSDFAAAASAPKAAAEGLTIRPYHPSDYGRLQEIRESAFRPIFASFRTVIGEPLSATVFNNADERQKSYLSSILDGQKSEEMYVSERDGVVVGFIHLEVDNERRVGQIGLNAVDPMMAGRGIGTAMYRFAISKFRKQGMKAARVATAGDPSHEAARRAYANAGFDSPLPTMTLYQDLETDKDQKTSPAPSRQLASVGVL